MRMTSNHEVDNFNDWPELKVLALLEKIIIYHLFLTNSLYIYISFIPLQSFQNYSSIAQTAGNISVFVNLHIAAKTEIILSNILKNSRTHRKNKQTQIYKL